MLRLKNGYLRVPISCTVHPNRGGRCRYKAPIGAIFWFAYFPDCLPHPGRSTRTQADHGAFAPIQEKENTMAFKGDADSSPQPSIVTAALDVFCREARIDPDTCEFDVARELILSLYRKGAATPEKLVAAIENELRPPQERQ